MGFGIGESRQESTINDQKVSLNAGGFGTSASNITNSHIEYGDAEVAKRALDTARAQSNAALETTYYALATLQGAQDRGLNTVDAAVRQANEIAQRAAPVSPGDYAKAVSEQNAKAFVIVALLVAAVFLFKKV